jgi:hypothetical protein
MAIIHFTLDDALDSQRDLSGMELLHYEEAADCDGEVCGGRPELILPPEEYRRHVAIRGERPPIGPHWHIVISRNHPGARRYQFHVW